MTIHYLDPMPPKFPPWQIDMDFHDWGKTTEGAPRLFGKFFCERHKIINPYLACVINPRVALHYVRHYYRVGAWTPPVAPFVEADAMSR